MPAAGTKKEIEDALNEHLDVKVKWSKLSISELEQIVSALRDPKKLMVPIVRDRLKRGVDRLVSGRLLEEFLGR